MSEIVLPASSNGLRTYPVFFASQPSLGLPTVETYLAEISTNGIGSNDYPYLVVFGTRVLGYSFSTNDSSTAWGVGLTYDLKFYVNAVLAATVALTSGSQFSRIVPDFVVAPGDLISVSTTQTNTPPPDPYDDVATLTLFLQEPI